MPKHPVFPLALALLHGISGLTILLVASWFIAACSVAGPNFNYVLPAVVIRGLALLRIGSGYADMWLSHHQLLHKLAAFRLSLFEQLENHPSSKRAIDTDKLNYQTQDLASVWTGWIHHNASAILSLLAITALVVISLPTFTWIWAMFAVLALSLNIGLLISGLNASREKIHTREVLEEQIEQHIDSSAIWHMQVNQQQPDCSALYRAQNRSDGKTELAHSLLLIVSIGAVALVLNETKSLSLVTPLALVLPMALLAANDWFGRTFFTHERLQDYLSSRKSLKPSGAADKQRIATQFERLTLHSFNVATGADLKLDLALTGKGGLLLTGSSGSGKSRLLQAMAGLLPHKGEKKLNNEILTSGTLLDDVLYVEQHPYCLSDTLRQNLLLANHNASDSRLRELMDMVALCHLSNLDEWVGSGGRQLSGGELKRLGLVRALLSNKSVVLIDEPFEALDGESLKKVVAAINQLQLTKYVVLASHIIPGGLAFDTHINLDEPASTSEAKVYL